MRRGYRDWALPFLPFNLSYGNSVTILSFVDKTYITYEFFCSTWYLVTSYPRIFQTGINEGWCETLVSLKSGQFKITSFHSFLRAITIGSAVLRFDIECTLTSTQIICSSHRVILILFTLLIHLALSHQSLLVNGTRGFHNSRVCKSQFLSS